MNKKIMNGLAAIAMISMTACSSFLDENPKSNLSSEGYLVSEAQAKSNVNYLYRTGAPTFDTGNGAYYGTNGMLGGYLTGYFKSEYAGQEQIVGESQTLSRTVSNCNSYMESLWQSAYRAINVANYSIKYTSSKYMDESVANQYIAEAKFFRAYNYFYLVKIFGDVPFYTEPFESATGDLMLSRTDKKTIYAQVVQDLKDAASVLPNKAFYDNSLRLTSNVANALLAEVYLQMSGYPINENHYADAAAAAKAVISSGKHSLTTNSDLGANSAYNKLRTIDGLPEVIYAYEYAVGISNATYRCAWAFPNAFSAYFKVTICVNVYGLVNGIENMYNDSEDLRHQPNQFFHWNYVFPGETTAKSLGATCNWYFYDADCLLNTAKGGKDANIIRYPEMLLIAAEGIAQSSGVTSEAVNYLAQVKARASMTGKTASDYSASLSALSKDAFIKEIWAERLREFPLEFKIWDDCVRTQMFPTFSADNKGKVTFVNLIGAKNGNGYTIKESDMYFPLPYSEIQRDPNLTQNTGY
ncbi:MAG: RagB/SusD family nutrient uptake outer membrane protein [Parabacteroides sp.]|nr:RagB/SusD family nutrient uptake outer membrane protein [Parabacteroides sp.]